MEDKEAQEGTKAQAIEYIHVKTTELYRLVIKVLKWIGIIAVTIFGLYLLTFIFEIFFFIAFFFAMPVIFPFFNKILEVKGEILIESRLGSPGENNKNPGDIVGVCIVPHNIIEACEQKGGNMSRIRSISGKPVILVEKFDPIKLEIIRAWIDEISSFKFLTDKNAFIKLREFVESLMDQILMTKRLRKLYQKWIYLESINNQELKAEIKEVESSIKEYKVNE